MDCMCNKMHCMYILKQIYLGFDSCWGLQGFTPLASAMNVTKGGLMLFSANSNTAYAELATKISEWLGVEPGKVQVYQEANRGLTHLITMDLHQKEIQGFFNIPVDNLRASPFLLQYIQEEIPDYRNAVIVAKSPASAKRAQSFAERLRLGIAVIHGEVQDADSDLVDGRHSPPTVKNAAAIHPSLELPMAIPKEKPPITVVGEVGGRIAIIVDDIIDDVDSFLAAADTLKERGAYKIYVMATHGLLSSDAPRLIEESSIDEVVVTNTIPHELQKLQCHKIKTVDISMILSEAIRRIHNGESMSYLFQNIGMDD
ncbi:phosphoribosyl pyrophosphate synthase-associated protein 2 isoform X5 [Rhinoraja longicauda]